MRALTPAYPAAALALATQRAPLPACAPESDFRATEAPPAADAPSQPSEQLVPARTVASVGRFNILVVGGPQTGKSSFINAFRYAVLGSRACSCLATAPFGRFGEHGTRQVDVYPNKMTNPTWALIDTPGHHFHSLKDPNSDDSVLLSLLMNGLPSQTPLLGRRALSVSQLSQLQPCAGNKAFHVVAVVSAQDLVVVSGRKWGILWRHYMRSDQSSQVVGSVSSLITAIRDFGLRPVLVVTHMDVIGWSARDLLLNILSDCMPIDRTFLMGIPPTRFIADPKAKLTADQLFSRRELLRMHELLSAETLFGMCRPSSEQYEPGK